MEVHELPLACIERSRRLWNFGSRCLSLPSMMGPTTRRLLFAFAVAGCTNEPVDVLPRADLSVDPADVQLSEPKLRAKVEFDATGEDVRGSELGISPEAKPRHPTPIVSPEAEPRHPTSAVSSESDSEATDLPSKPAAGPTFTVHARLVDAGRSVPHCGVIHFKVVMKFEVLKVLDGRFDSTTLYAGVSCPEMPPTRTRKFRWTVDDTYEVKLRTAGLRRTGALVDAFKAEPGKRYELLHIEPSK